MRRYEPRRQSSHGEGTRTQEKSRTRRSLQLLRNRRLTWAEIRRLVVTLVLNCLAMAFTIRVVPGVSADVAADVVLTTILLGVLAAALRPLMTSFALVLGWVGVLIAGFGAQALLFYLALIISPGIHVDGFWDAFWALWIFAILMSIVTWLALVAYAKLPRSVGIVVATSDQRALLGLPFDCTTLTPEHVRVLDSLAREIVRSWYSRKIVTKIAVQGHTDRVGTKNYNYELGRRRADAVATRLKHMINQFAGPTPAGAMERIQYVVESFGEDKPFSKRIARLNRRVELTLHRDNFPPPNPLKLDDTVRWLNTLLTSQQTLDAETVTRLRCLLSKLQTLRGCCRDFETRSASTAATGSSSSSAAIA
jgi:uncharacterized membrane protein YvlD (DUF360 family)